MAGELGGDERVRTAELIAALCLATDLGMAFPFEHGLHTTLIATRLADKLGIDRRSASETYYACLLSHAGCTTEAHVAAEVFGGSLTTSFNPLMYGSAREVLTGLLRALPDPGSPALVRTLQTARRLPRMARETRPSLSARPARSPGCWQIESALPRPCRAFLPTSPSAGTDTARCAGPKGSRSLCRCGSSTSRQTLPSSVFVAGQSTQRTLCASEPGTRSTRR